MSSRVSLALALTVAVGLTATLTGCGDNLECIGDRCVVAEDCATPGDEDLDGAADCDDTDCAAEPACQGDLCGNGTQNVGEECDDGNADDTDACTSACRDATCGDGLVQAGVEQCDDANTVDTDACTNACTTARCGDGVMGPGEQCDDGNMVDTDGCTNTCTTARCGDGMVQPGEACDDGNMVNTDGCTNLCRLPTCGDGFMQAGEQCDDGNMDNGDACLNTCMTATCGDGVVRAGAEQCDDMDTMSGDGCSATCTTEPGWTCAMMPSVCVTRCGDGIIAGAEMCDQGNGNVAPGDGCSPMCQVETGWTCAGMPSMCMMGGGGNCGNGTVDPGEQCDDGNMIAADGCGVTCQFDIGCPAGDTQVVFTRAVVAPIADNMTTTSTIMVNDPNVVRKVVVYLGSITHTATADLDISLAGPRMIVRDLSSDNGGAGDNFRRTFFDDGAATSIIAGTAPFTGRFRPEQALSGPGGFRGQLLGGPWTLTVTDDAANDTGTLDSWSIIACSTLGVSICGNGNLDAGEECDDGNNAQNDACLNSCIVGNGCGDGNLDAGEQCDDDNVASGDGCSSFCQLEQTCPAGQVPITVANNTATPIPDNDLVNGASSGINIGAGGAVTSVRVYVGGITHADDAHLKLYLQAPNGSRRELSTDNGGTGNDYTGTLFDDAATAGVATGMAPFTGSFRPEQTLSSNPGTDFRGLRAFGTWALRVFDDTAGSTGNLTSWSLLMCVDPAAGFCGNGAINGNEECDDGNLIDNDGCSNLCGITSGCGDGDLDMGEACDDDNRVSGDGCSATCQLDIGCAAGEMAVITSSAVSTGIPDNSPTGAVSTIAVPTAGLVRRAIVTLDVTHANDAHVDLYLMSPRGGQRVLSDDQPGANYTRTIFSDSAVLPITAGSDNAVAPYTGSFQPEETLAAFNGQSAQGDWYLRAADDTQGTLGSLTSWTLALCVDPSAATRCGNGVVEQGETCDDGNAAAGDGCSNTCQLELGCAVGQTPVVVSSADERRLVPDNSMVGVTSTVNVAAVGRVAKTVVVVNSITSSFDDDLDLALVRGNLMPIELSTDNGDEGNDYLGTIFADAATRAIAGATAASAPFGGLWRPEGSLAGLNGQLATGAWALRAVDDSQFDTGMFHSWTLGLCLMPAP